MSCLPNLHEQVFADHTEETGRGEHDDQCEHRPAGFYLCHCSKRARQAQGFTEPPGELIFRPPSCPRCYRDVVHDGDAWTCKHCCCQWDASGEEAEFTDDYC